MSFNREEKGNEDNDQAIIGVEENEHEKIGALLEEENDPDEYLTLGDINIRLEMNASNREST